MWIKQSDRKNLTEVLVGNTYEAPMGCHASDSFPVDLITGNDLYLIWDLEPKDKRSLPNIIVVADGHLRDFLAWAITYFPAYRPFTAFFRVLEFKALASFKSWFEPPSLDAIETACVGLIISETLLLSAAAERPASIAAVTSSTTISYVLSRALALGADENQMDIVCEKWSLARKLTEQPARKLDIKHVKDIYQMLTLLRSGGRLAQQLDSNTGVPPVVVEACSQLKGEGKVSDKTWDELTAGVEELTAAQRQMKATREDRVRYFQRLISNQSFPRLTGEVVQAFVCGYLGSLIGPGSLSHIELVARFVSHLPTVLLWYGLCAGFHKKNDLLTSFNVLGRRLLRELLRNEPLLSPPVADIAASELQVLLEGNSKPFEFRTFVSNRVVTELLPCISTYLVWPKREPKQQMALFPKSVESPIRSELLSDLGSLLQEALDIHRLLVKPADENRRNLNGTTKKKSRKKKSK